MLLSKLSSQKKFVLVASRVCASVSGKPLIHKALASERRNSANSKSSNVKLEPTSSIYKSLVPKSNAWNNKVGCGVFFSSDIEL